MKSRKCILLVCIIFMFTLNESYSRTVDSLAKSKPLSQNSPLLDESLRADLYAVNADNTISLEDGNLELYSTSYCNCVNWLEDAKKVTNYLENFAIERNGKLMSIESKQPIGLADTVFYNMTQMRMKTYYLGITAANLNHPNLFGFLQDNYTGASTPINLNGITDVKFSVTADPASSNPNRFQIIFTTISILSGVTPVPVTYTSIKAQQQNSNIGVEWQVTNEINVSKYQVEKSADGIVFNTVATIEASGNTTSVYNWVDIGPASGNNFYRIKEIDDNGFVQYSKIIKATAIESGYNINVYPNPIVSGVIGLQTTNLATGVYTIRLLNNFGQVLYSKQISHSKSSLTESVNVPLSIAKGIYRLELIHPDYTATNINVVF